MAEVTLPEWQNYLRKFREAVVPDWGQIATSEKLAPSPAWAPLLMGARAGGRAFNSPNTAQMFRNEYPYGESIVDKALESPAAKMLGDSLAFPVTGTGLITTDALRRAHHANYDKQESSKNWQP